MLDTTRDGHPRGRADVELFILPDKSCLLFDPLAGEGHVLTVAGALVWDYCDGTLSRSEIAEEVAALLPQFPQARDEVLALLEGFAQRGLLLDATSQATRP